MSAGKESANVQKRPALINASGSEAATITSSLSSTKVLLLPLVITVALLLVATTQRVSSNPILLWSFLISAAGLLMWQAVLFLRLLQGDSRRTFEIILRPQHYVQAMVQGSLYLYWGYHWQPVYDHFWLLLGQLLFAFAFDILLAWTRRQNYVLGFGAFPIVFSINLFLWFRDDWFYMQFLMIAAGFMGKEFVRWQRDGKSVHIFNPSAFTLGLFSIILIATNTSDLTWGQEIASTLTLAPNIYTFLFLIGLVVMYFFSITLLTGTAAMMLFALSALYSAISGVPYFLDSEIPAAVFLGMHLLISDPSTSPRTPLGKTLFGALYGLGVFLLYSLLDAIGSPTFYDKLLCVPLLNLCVIAIDNLVRKIHFAALINMWKESWLPVRANIAHMVVWIALFGTMTVMGKTDGLHTGDSVPFWQQACADGRTNACKRLLQLESTYCGDNSAWACNELGIKYQQGRLVDFNAQLALGYFARACELKFQAGCLNLLNPSLALHEPPHELDLRLLLRQGGLNLMAMPAAQLYPRACEHGWEFACGRTVASL